MNFSPQQHAPDPLHLGRWQTLTTAEKLQEFRELTTSPYWKILSSEIKSRIQTLVAASPPPALHDRKTV